MKKYLLIIILFVLIFNIPFISSLELPSFESSHKNKDLFEAFKIIRTELTKNYSVNDFTVISPQDQQLHEFMINLKSEFNYNDWVIKISDSQNNSSDQHRNSIFLVDRMKTFEEINHFIEPSKFLYSGLHIIILINGDIQDIHKIFEVFWSKSIYNIYALLNDKEILLATFELFKNPSNCGNTSPKVFNKFKHGKFEKPLILSKKFNNLNKCPIIASTFTDGVASFKQKFLNGSSAIRGYEIEMIRVIAAKLNFSLDLRFRKGPQQWGVIFENGTITETLGVLKNKSIDIAIGNYNLRGDRAHYFEFSSPYFSYQVLFVLSLSEKLTAFEKLLRPFHIIVWILIFVVLCFGMLVIFIINMKFKSIKNFVYGTNVNYPVLNMLGAVMGSSQVILPKRNFARFILMLFIIYCLILRTLYQGSLYKFLQQDERQKQPEKIQELIEQKYNFLMGMAAKEYIRKSHPKICNLAKNIHNISTTSIDLILEENEKSALFTSKVELICYSQTHNNFPYKILNEKFNSAYVVLYYSKNFFLKRDIDEVLQKIQTSGLFSHWLSEYDKTDRWKMVDVNPRILTFEHLSGAFYLLIIGSFICVLVLMLEILCTKIKK